MSSQKFKAKFSIFIRDKKSPKNNDYQPFCPLLPAGTCFANSEEKQQL